MAYDLQAFAEGTLSATLVAGATSGTLTAGHTFQDATKIMLVIDPDVSAKREIVEATISSDAITSITRGKDNTSDVEHAAGAKVWAVWAPSNAGALNKLWASTITVGTTLTSAGTATMTNNPDYTITKIDPNAVGTKGTADKWGILGGFYFSAPRTGYYHLSAVETMMQLQSGSAGIAGFIRITQDTSNPAQNNDSSDDGGTMITGSFAGATTPGAGWADTVCLKSEVVVSLTAGTTYYFTVQAKYQGAGSATAFNISSIAGAGATLTIRELDGN